MPYGLDVLSDQCCVIRLWGPFVLDVMHDVCALSPDGFARARCGTGGVVTTAATSAIAHHADLIAAVAQQRDKAAFAELFQYFAPRVKAYLIRLGVPSGAADDLAQEALLMVWRKAHLYDRSRAAPSTWVFTIARNLRTDAARRIRYTETLDDGVDRPDDALLADDVLSAAQRDARVRSALKALPQDQLRVVELSFFEDKPHSDIARILDIPLGTVKSRLRLAMGRLKPLVGVL